MKPTDDSLLLRVSCLRTHQAVFNKENSYQLVYIQACEKSFSHTLFSHACFSLSRVLFCSIRTQALLLSLALRFALTFVELLAVRSL